MVAGGCSGVAVAAVVVVVGDGVVEEELGDGLGGEVALFLEGVCRASVGNLVTEECAFGAAPDPVVDATSDW